MNIDNMQEEIKVLLVEDNSNDYFIFCHALEDHEVEIIWAKSSEEAKHLLDHNGAHFDLVVCDFHLPMMSGLELSKWIVDQKLTLPVVLLTGSGNEDVAVEALQAGVNDYLVKDIQGRYIKTIPVKLSRAISQFNHQLERQQNAEELAIAAKVFSHTNEAIIVTNAENKIESVNQAFTDITGFQPEDVLGKNPRFLASGQHGADFYQQMWQSIKDTNGWEGEIWNRKKNGEIFPEWLVINAIFDSNGLIIHYIGIYTDIGHLKRTEQQLYEYAYSDNLTKLPNRASFMESLHRELESSQRDKTRLALMFIDLDHFKWVNDHLGHTAGDKFLIIVADRLKKSIRSSDIVARFAGDEFTVILRNIKHSKDVAVMAEKILSKFSALFYIDHQELSISASIGIAVCPEDGDSANDLLKHADVAMYRSKSSGRNTYQFFTKDMHDHIQKNMQRVAELRRAILENQFIIHYQPFVDIKTGKLLGAEALVRWQHPDMGLMGPNQFIHLAEETGLIIPLGKFIFQKVCQQVSEWQEAGYQVEQVAINLSKLQLMQINLLNELAEVIAGSGVNTTYITLEITESLMMEEQDKMIDVLKALKKLGFKLSLDDFGTGYSSLSQIKFFPLDFLKIPMAFVQDVTSDMHNAVLAETIIKMGHSLDLKVVAEGIETQQQLDFLRQHQCDIGQGYFFSQGLDAQKMSEFLKK